MSSSENDEILLSEEEDAMELESQDESQSNEEQPVSSVKKEQKKHKKSYDPRFSVPTYEEKQMMRNADMEVELSLLEMEAQAYVEGLDVKHACEEKIAEYLKSINTFLTKLEEKDITPSSVKSESFYKYVVDASNDSKEIKLRFCKPEAVYVIGSYTQKTYTSSPFIIDLSLQLADKCISERDLINWRYFNKRSLYLAQLAKELKKAFPTVDLHYEWLHGDFDKPCLLLTIPSSICPCGSQIRFLPVPSLTVFSLSKLLPSRNNVHLASDSDVPSTWYYNCSILEDCLSNHYSTFILNYLRQYPNLIPSLRIIRNWLKASCFDKHLTLFISAIILCLLVQKQRVTSLLAPWQVFIVFLDYLASSSLLEGVHFRSDASTIDYDEEAYSNCIRLLDDSYGYNITYRLDSYNYQEITERAKNDLQRIRGVYSTMLLPSLLNKPKSLFCEYDLVIRLKLTDLEKEVIYGKKNAELNYPLYVHCLKDIEFWCRKALQTRAEVVRTEFTDGLTWKIDEKYPKPEYILLCVRLNEMNISKFADKGPAAKTEEVKDWLYLWGNKSELRRYQDGSILYTNLWSCKPGENHLIPAEIIRYVLSLHTMAVIELKNLSQNLQPFILPSPSLECSDKISDFCQMLMEVVNSHNKNNGIDFSAQISSIDPVSTVLYGCECNSGIYSNPYLNNKSTVGTHPVTTIVKPIEFIIQMQGVVGLPDDLTIIQKIKSLWYTSIAILLEKKHVECLVNRDYLDVVLEGSILRFRCCTTREIQLYSKLPKNEETLKQTIFYSFMSNHTFTMKNLALQNPSFVPCLRLVRLWLSGNLISASIPSFIIDLCLFAVYEKYNPLNPVRGFLQFLQFVKDFDWKNDILILNSNHSLSNEKIHEIQNEFETKKKEGNDGRFIFICTSYDLQSLSTYTVTEPAIWNRFIRLASKSYSRIIENYMSMNQDGINSIFTASEKEFDVVLRIKDEYLTPTPLTKIMGENQKNRGIVYMTKEPRNVMFNRSRLLIGYDPELCLYECIKKIVGNGGVVLMNKEYGNKLYITWKPSYFIPMKMSMANVMNGFAVWKEEAEKGSEEKDDMEIIRDVFEMIAEMKEKMGQVLQSIRF